MHVYNFVFGALARLVERRACARADVDPGENSQVVEAKDVVRWDQQPRSASCFDELDSKPRFQGLVRDWTAIKTAVEDHCMTQRMQAAQQYYGFSYHVMHALVTYPKIACDVVIT